MSSDIIYLDIISKSVTDIDFFLYEKPWGKNPKSIERLNQKKHKISKLSMLKKYLFFFRGKGKGPQIFVCQGRQKYKVHSDIR